MGVCRYAYVEFSDPQLVTQALVLNDSIFRGRQLKVYFHPPSCTHPGLTFLTQCHRSQPSARTYPAYNIAADEADLWEVHEEVEAMVVHEAEVDTEEVAVAEADMVHREDSNLAEGKFSHLAYNLSISNREG